VDALYVVSVEVMYQISMMFLRANKDNLLDKMKKNINNLDPDTMANHRMKIKQLTEQMYPNFLPGKAFQRNERALGNHLSKAIMAISKNGKKQDYAC
jgi:hypothetical protein